MRYRRQSNENCASLLGCCACITMITFISLLISGYQLKKNPTWYEGICTVLNYESPYQDYTCQYFDSKGHLKTGKRYVYQSIWYGYCEYENRNNTHNNLLYNHTCSYEFIPATFIGNNLDENNQIRCFIENCRNNSDQTYWVPLTTSEEQQALSLIVAGYCFLGFFVMYLCFGICFAAANANTYY